MHQAAGNGLLVRFGALLRPFRLQHAYQREVFFIATVGLCAFYVTALASFHPTDPTWISATFPPARPENLAGKMGAQLAGLAIFAFGFAAFAAPLPLLSTAVALLRKSEKSVALGKAMGWMLAFSCLTAVAAAHLPAISFRGFDFPSGGAFGESILTFLVNYLGKVGSAIALVSMGSSSVLLIFEKSLLMPAAGKIKSFLSRSASSDAATPEPLPKLAQPVNLTSDPVDRFEIPISETVVDISFNEPAVFGTNEQTERFMASDLPEQVHSAASEHQRIPLQKPKNDYVTPPVSIFQTAHSMSTASAVNMKELETTGQLLTKTFADFGVIGKIIGYQPGPVVTVFEFQPDAGVKQSKVLSLIDDIALTLKVDSIFIHPVHGKRALGIQVPNTKRETVYLGDILSTEGFKGAPSPLTFGMGKTISGQPISADLTTMPHLLMAGATGTGKSVAINALLCSIVMKSSPEDVRLILVDPKMLELSVYEGIPHLLMPVITEPTRASMALKWAASEMERRYKLMQLACVRNISGFNTFWNQASTSRKEEIQAQMGDDSIVKLPYILLVIDELADLMLTAPKDVESSIQRLAQKARASGIHMVLATQRPSVDIITGVIKANLPCRISFQVVSKHDSRTILDQMGAEKLLGKGDMLFQRPGVGRIERIQGALISDEEVLNLVANVKSSAAAEYDQTIMGWIEEEVVRAQSQDSEGADLGASMDDDPKYDEAVTIAKTHGVVSASFLQRHLKIGYNRAARMVEFMEAKGYVAKADGAKPRKWLGPLN